MKRTDNHQGRCIRKHFSVTFAHVSFAIVRMAIALVLFIGMVYISPAGISQALAVEKIQPANPEALPSTSLKTIIVNDYYPYTFVNDKGVPDGFSLDVAKAVVGVMGLKLTISVDTWERATNSLADGTIELLPMMAYSPERDKSFDFSAPHTIAYDALFLRKGAPQISSLKDLVNKTVIVMNKDAAHQYLLSSGMAAKMKLILVDSLPDALRILAEGKGDAALMPKLVGLTIVNNLNLTNLDPSPIVIDAYNRPFSFAVRDGNQALLERLSQGLSIINTTGRYREIYNKWFGSLEPPGLSWKTVIKYVGAMLVVFLLVGSGLSLWTLSLRKQVSLRTKHLAVEIEERKRAEEALRNSERKYRNIFENATEGIFQSTPEGRYVSVNPSFARIGGYDSPEEMIDTVTDIQRKMYVHQEDRARLVKLLNKQDMINNFEVEIRRRDNAIIWISMNVKAIRDQDGKIMLLEGTIEDITERKRAEEEIRKLNVELEQRVAARTAELAERTRQMETFTYSVSHDLKAPLRGIDGYSRLLLEDYSDRLDEEGRTFLTTIRQATEQMRQLIEDLLAYSRMERRSLASHNVHPLDLMQTLIAERTEEINARNVSVALDMPDVVVKADPEGLAQVLRNLLDNALKFTGKIPDPHIEIGGQEKEEHCVFWVRDNGIGFDMRYHDRIFEIFQRLHPVEEYPGTGIGMAIVQKAMQRMGGRVWAEGAPGKGAAFYLEVPK